MAVITQVLVAAIGFVDMENVVVEAPGGTVTEAGTTAFGRFDISSTFSPFAPLVPKMVKDPVAAVPPTTEPGATENADTVGGSTVTEIVFEVVPLVSVTFTNLAIETPEVGTITVTELVPGATFSEEGICTLASEDFRLNTEPDGPA